MEMTVLGKTEIEQLRDLRAAAEAHPYCLREMIEMKNSGKKIDKDVSLTRTIPRDIKVVMTVEEQPGMTGYTNHFSFSRPAPHAVSVASVMAILRCMGFNYDLLDALHIWIECDVHDCNGNSTDAINLIFPMHRNEPIDEPV